MVNIFVLGNEKRDFLSFIIVNWQNVELICDISMTMLYFQTNFKRLFISIYIYIYTYVLL